jgi:hypothetical protein
MQKIAQERHWLNKLREKTDVSGKILESINPEFAEMMDNLRKTDEKIRNQAAGIKDIVKWSRTLVNRRDYLSASLNIAAFHERCRLMAFALEQCQSKVDLKHFQFLLDQFDDEYKERLFGYNPERSLKEEEPLSYAQANEISKALIKNAGLSDFLSLPISDMAQNLSASRTKAMRALEKRFSVGFLKKIKTDSIAMVDKTEEFLRYLLLTFKKLATAVATRNAEEYVANAKDFVKKFAVYHKLFLKFYNDNVVPLRKFHDDAKTKALEEQSKNLHAVMPSQPGPDLGLGDTKPSPAAARQQSQEEVLNQLERAHGPVGANKPAPSPNASVPPTIMPPPEEEDKTEKHVQFPPSPLKVKPANHQAFIDSLYKNADPLTLANSILRYAAVIEEDHEVDALKLIAIAEGILDDINDAGDKKTKKEPELEPKKDKPEKPDPLA